MVANLDEANVEAFASLGDALDVEMIREWFVGKPIEALVIGPRTSVIVHMTSMGNTRRPLSRREIENIRPIADSKDLAEYFAVMLDSFARVCGKPCADGTLEVVAMKQSRFHRRSDAPSSVIAGCSKLRQPARRVGAYDDRR